MNNKMTVKLIIKKLTNYSKNDEKKIDEKNENLIFRELANNIMNSYPFEEYSEYEESEYEESEYEESEYEDKPTFPEKNNS